MFDLGDEEEEGDEIELADLPPSALGPRREASAGDQDVPLL